MQSSKAVKKNIQWDKYMVYLIFVGVFLVFAVVDRKSTRLNSSH